LRKDRDKEKSNDRNGVTPEQAGVLITALQHSEKKESCTKPTTARTECDHDSHLLHYHLAHTVHSSPNNDNATKQTQVYKAFYFNFSQLHSAVYKYISILKQFNKHNTLEKMQYSFSNTHTLHFVSAPSQIQDYIYLWQLTAHMM